MSDVPRPEVIVSERPEVIVSERPEVIERSGAGPASSAWLPSQSPTESAPGRPAGPGWLGDRTVDAATPRVLVAVAAIAIAGDVAIRSGIDTFGGAIGAVVTSGALLMSGRLVNRSSIVLVLLAPAFAVWIAFRQSGWLVPLDVIAAAGLMILAALLGRAGSVFHLAPMGLLQRSGSEISHAVAAPAFVVRPLRGNRGTAVVRGAFVAAPIVAVIVALLASADRVFARLLGLDLLDGSDVFVHICLLSAGAWTGAALLQTASSHFEPTPIEGPRWLGIIEATVVLSAVALVLAIFGVAQVLDLVGASRRIVESDNLTYAQYARTGFFQLLWVAGIVVAVVLVVRVVVRGGDVSQQSRCTRLGVATCALTLPVVTVSLRRLELYRDEFGLTMLRLFSTTAAIVIGVIVVLVAAAIAGVRRDRVWLPGAAMVTGLTALFMLNVLNPEAFVARTNLERAAPIIGDDHADISTSLGSVGGGIDEQYLSDLSADAIPTIANHLDRLSTSPRAFVINQLCRREFRSTNWLGSNRSVERARSSLRGVCP